MPNINNGVLDGLRRLGARFRDVTVDGGLPGAPLGFRMRGATQSGAPASGTWKAGDHVEDRTGGIWICTAGGTPGTWAQAGGQVGLSYTGPPALAPSAGSSGFAVDANGASWIYQASTSTWVQTTGLIPECPVVMTPVKWAMFNYDTTGTGTTPDIGATNGVYANGTAGVGATITASVNEALTIDGNTPAIGDRVVVHLPFSSSLTLASTGIYTVTSLGSGSSKWVLTRAVDMNTSGQLFQCWTVYVTSGTLMAGGRATSRMTQSNGPITRTIGTTTIVLSIQSSGSFATLVGQNTATGTAGNLHGSATALGTQASAIGDQSVAVGNSATTNGGNSTALGPYSWTNGDSSVAVGAYGYTVGGGFIKYGVAVGAYSLAYAYGQMAFASGQISQIGDAQRTMTVFSGKTTSATPAAITPDGAGINFDFAKALTALTAEWNRTCLLTATLVARNISTPGTDSAWTCQGVLRGNASNAYSWVGGSAPTFTLVAQDSGASTWSGAITLTSSNIIVTVTGQASTNIVWTCVVQLDEVRG